MRQRLVALTTPRVVHAYLLSSGALLGLSVAASGLVTRRTGTPDAANTLVVARNLLERGRFEVDYLSHYFRQWPSITHPEDSFPLLHPSLVAAISLPFGDPLVGASVYAGLVTFGLLGVLPWLVASRAGALAGFVSFAIALSFEARSSVLTTYTNDAGAMLLAGLGFTLYACDREEPTGGSRLRFAMASTLLSLAALHKTSAGFVALAVLLALLADNGLRVRERTVRGGLLVGCLALLHAPVVAWSHQNLGELGLPHNAPARGFVRTIAHRSDFIAAWEAHRTYWPQHGAPTPPISLSTHGARLVDAITAGLPMLLPLPWLAATVAYARRSRTSGLARLLLLAACCAFLVPAYSHYEARYLFPLRPIIGVVLAFIAQTAWEELDGDGRGWRVALGASMLLVWIPLGLPRSVVMGAATGAALVSAAWAFVPRGPPRGVSLITARARFALIAIALPPLCLAGGITDRLHGPLLEEPEPHRALARVVEEGTAATAVVMTRRPSNLSYLTRRRCIMLPFAAADVCAAATRHGATTLAISDEDLHRLGDVTPMLEALPVRGRYGTATLYELRCGNEEHERAPRK
jgi:hypothetical protein